MTHLTSYLLTSRSASSSLPHPRESGSTIAVIKASSSSPILLSVRECNLLRSLFSSSPMDQSSAAQGHATHDFPPFFKVYSDGRVERYKMFGEDERVPAGEDSVTGVRSKDVIISSETGVSARIWIPRMYTTRKLPLLIHYHGGGFCVGSPFDSVGERFFSRIVPKANVVAISIDYRLAPENPLPTAHEDAFGALKWLASHSGGHGPEPWINEYADLHRTFLSGESAGGNIAHYAAIRAGTTSLTGLRIVGSIVVHPFFVGKEPDKMIMFMCPGSPGTEEDPLINPAVDPNLPAMAGERVLVCIAERDGLRDRGVKYYETLRDSQWTGKVELEETFEEDHCFHMFKRTDKADQLLQRMADFINRD
ncbi:hypothetical protein SAY86_023201 [Trapa natans]|uniref:Alpha/beta hydrolase fold-3 domain-containing protein n=1 Tax=Trapa natans TaxID=22666 RepID=A0AAN7R9Z0_TRANT|nr:hypothetical protein SAY86_023201 [Trapa natans]